MLARLRGGLVHQAGQAVSGKARPGFFFADWFSGELRYLPLKFYWGKVISECEALETASLMHVERGVLTYRNKNRS